MMLRLRWREERLGEVKVDESGSLRRDVVGSCVDKSQVGGGGGT